MATKKTAKSKTPSPKQATVTKRRPTKKKTVTTAKKINRIVFILDGSGSMNRLTSKVCEVYNKWIEQIKTENAKHNQVTTLSQIGFSSNVKVSKNNEDIEVASKLRREDFYSGNATALFDALTTGIDTLQGAKNNSPDESFLVITITDGWENASSAGNIQRFKNEVFKLQKEGNWSFVFLMPPGTSHNFCTTYGVPNDNVREWEGTEEGILQAQQITTEGLSDYYTSRSRGIRSTSTFYRGVDLSKVKSKDIDKLTDLSDVCKVYNVPKEDTIKPFVEGKTRRPYVKGQAYYQLTKKELVQPDKQILVMENGKKEIYGGTEARDLIGLPQTANARIDIMNLSKYTVFIQSKSDNRILPRGVKVIIRTDVC